MSVIPRARREGQNTGRRAPTAREVETQPCKVNWLRTHELVNSRNGETYCRGCCETWADLDLAINGERRAS